MNTHTNTTMEKQLYVGYTKEELVEMYDEAKAMVFFSIIAKDRESSKRWSRIAVELSITLHALEKGHL